MSIFIPVVLLIGTKSYPLGLWARVVPTVSEPVSFLNPIEHSEIVILFCEFITDLTSLPFNSYFSEPLSGGYGYFCFAIVVFVYGYDGFVILYDVMIISI